MGALRAVAFSVVCAALLSLAGCVYEGAYFEHGYGRGHCCRCCQCGCGYDRERCHQDRWRCDEREDWEEHQHAHRR
ncbi:MAG: hypothetical protein NTW86_11120 [Candidatus Sumerlaeota bacterium]|nr:hypothetical protein [Candidatus Sumerlaeota bacterium]